MDHERPTPARSTFTRGCLVAFALAALTPGVGCAPNAAEEPDASVASDVGRRGVDAADVPVVADDAARTDDASDAASGAESGASHDAGDGGTDAGLVADGAPPNADAGSTIASVVRTVVGDDWSLPTGIAPADRSGIYGASPAELNSVVTVGMPNLNWAQMQRADGVFDFASLDQKLSAGPITIRMWCGSPDRVPAFIVARHPEWRTFTNAEGDVELPQWSPGWLAEWRPFVTALANRYKNHPNLRGFQLQITADGEAWMPPQDVTNFERLGLTPAALQDFLAGYYAHAVSAFAGVEWKVFTVFHPYFFNSGTAYDPQRYATAVRAATLPQFARGMGVRISGINERFDTAAEWPEASSFANGMLVTRDDTFAPYLSLAHVDGQLENWYGRNRSPNVVTSDPVKLRYAIRMSLLRVLADRYSFVWLDGDDADFAETAYPGLVHYARLVLGKRPSEAPDAMLVLGDWSPNTTTTVRAWPRWITPLNLAATSTGVPIDTTGLGFVGGGQSLGRAIATAAPLQLAVDDRFFAPGRARDVTVLVEYRDDSARFSLEYDSVGGAARTPVVSGTGSGAWKTVTFRVPSAVFAGRLAGGADLRIVPTQGTPIVQLVRVVR